MFPDPRMRFPVIARKFPVRLKKFPVPSLREFAKIIEQCQHVTGKFKARSGCFCENSLFFPCLTGKSPLWPQRRVRSGLPPPPPAFRQTGVHERTRRKRRGSGAFGRDTAVLGSAVLTKRALQVSGKRSAIIKEVGDRCFGRHTHPRALGLRFDQILSSNFENPGAAARPQHPTRNASWRFAAVRRKYRHAAGKHHECSISEARDRSCCAGRCGRRSDEAGRGGAATLVPRRPLLQGSKSVR